MTNAEMIQTALANEARRSELKNKISKLQGAATATASLQSRISSINADATRELQDAQAELAALEAGAGPGVTADFGIKSGLTQLLESERKAGNAAVVAHVKQHPACTEAEAIEVWRAAAVASHPDIAGPLLNAADLGRYYRGRLVEAGAVSDASWGAFASWVAATPASEILD